MSSITTISEQQQYLNEQRQKLEQARRNAELGRVQEQEQLKQIASAETILHQQMYPGSETKRPLHLTRQQRTAQTQYFGETQGAIAQGKQELTTYGQQLTESELGLNEFEKQIQSAEAQLAEAERQQVEAQKQYEEDQRAYSTQLREYNKVVKDLSSIGLTPVYVKGNLTGFTDTVAGKSVSLEGLNNYLEELSKPTFATIPGFTGITPITPYQGQPAIFPTGETFTVTIPGRVPTTTIEIGQAWENILTGERVSSQTSPGVLWTPITVSLKTGIPIQPQIQGVNLQQPQFVSTQLINPETGLFYNPNLNIDVRTGKPFGEVQPTFGGGPSWFEFNNPLSTSLGSFVQGLIPSERLQYELEKGKYGLESQRSQIFGKAGTPGGDISQQLYNVAGGAGGAIVSTIGLVEHPVKTVKQMYTQDPLSTLLIGGGTITSLAGFPEFGIPIASLGYGYSKREEFLENPLSTVSQSVGELGGFFLMGEAIKPVTTRLKTIGAGEKYNIQKITTPEGVVRYVDLVSPEGKPIRVLLQEGKYAASEKPSVISQLKYAAEAKGMKVFTQFSPSAIKTEILPNGEIGFRVASDRGLYFAPESILVQKGMPQAYTYYGELSGMSREISYPRYLWDKFVEGRSIRIAQGGQRAVINIIQREFPDMPRWLEEVLVKRTKNLSSQSSKAIEYWSNLFDIENSGKVFKFKDKKGVIHDLTPDGLIKSIIKKKNPTSLELKAAKALYWWNIKTGRGILGGPEYITLPHGPEAQLVEPVGKAFTKITPTSREKILRKVGIERGRGYSILDNNVIDINFYKALVPVKEKVSKVSETTKISKVVQRSVIDTITSELVGRIEQPSKKVQGGEVRVRTPKLISRASTTIMSDLLVGEERTREPIRRSFEEVRVRERISERLQPIGVRGRYTLILERPRPTEVRERATLLPERPRPVTIRERARLPTMPRITERPRPEIPRLPSLTVIPRIRPLSKLKIKKEKAKAKKKGREFVLRPTAFQLTEDIPLTSEKPLSQITGFEVRR